MEKACGIVVFLSVYQLAGLNNFHDYPIIETRHLTNVCTTVRDTIGWDSLC